MKLILHPNDEQLSAWLGEAERCPDFENLCVRYGPGEWDFGFYVPDTWPDLDDAALRGDRKQRRRERVLMFYIGHGEWAPAIARPSDEAQWFIDQYPNNYKWADAGGQYE